MTGPEYLKAIAALGLSKAESSVFLDVTDRTARTYATQGPPAVVQKLLRTMLAEHISVAEVNAVFELASRWHRILRDVGRTVVPVVQTHAVPVHRGREVGAESPIRSMARRSNSRSRMSRCRR